MARKTEGAASDVTAIKAVRMDERKASTRAGFLRTLHEIIGPRPARDEADRLPWRAEYEPLAVVWMESMRVQLGEARHFESVPHAELVSFLRTSEGGDYLMASAIDRPQQLQLEQPKIDLLIRKGWHPEHAEAFQLLFPLRSALSADLEREHTHGVRFPACNYAVAEALFATAANRRHAALSVQAAPRRLFKHLTGPNSLTEADSAWAGLKTPDRTGFRGLTSTALCVATDDPRSFVPEGFRNKTASSEEGEVSYDLVVEDGGGAGSAGGSTTTATPSGGTGTPAPAPAASDVVCFESADNEDELMHSCVMIDEHHGALPANTLFRLKRVEEAGTWSAKLKSTRTKKHIKSTPEELAREIAALEASLVRGTIHPNCRLFVVGVTFKRPTEVADGWAAQQHAKLCGSVRTLLYASRETYVNGLDDILEDPVLTLAEEFARPGPSASFVDWRGVKHELKELWAYATGPAKVSVEGAGVRDKANDGMTPQDFMARANAHIASQRSAFVARHASADGSIGCRADGFDPELLLLNEADAMLTLEETLAVRLYSGPAFQPINDFLREVGKLGGEFRRQMARHRELTFAATTRHLCRAVRKLADVTRDEGATSLYRAVRGELPPAFWDRDPQGMISAVDAGFMSTSKNVQTPVSYMQGQFNVLWRLHASEPSDDAYHRGADISMLSQYAHEDEVLFPPNTMLIVQPAEAGAGGGGSAAGPAGGADHLARRGSAQAALSADVSGEGGKAWKEIHVQPCFV